MNNVSFKSILVFTLDDRRAKLPIPEFIKTTFETKSAFKNYKLVCPEEDEFVKNPDDKYSVYPYKYEGGVINGNEYNANTNFAKKMDKTHKKRLKEHPNEVILSEAVFSTDPLKPRQTRYFLTAATGKDEDYIQNVYVNLKRIPYIFAKFYDK